MVLLTNQDAVEASGIFLSRQLEQLLPRIYGKRYPTLKFLGQLLPASGTLESGADTVVEEIMNTVGTSDDAISDQVDDIPLADFSISDTKFPVVCKPIAFRYSIRELDAARKANRPLKAMKEFAAKRAIDETFNRLGAFGDSRYNVKGLLSDPNVAISDLSVDLYADATTPDQLAKAITGEVTKIIKSSGMTEEPNVLAVPVSLHERLTNERLTDTGSTVKKFILENNTWIEEIIPVNELSHANLEQYGVDSSGTNKDSMLIYPKNPETVERLFEPLQILAPQLRGLHYVVIMYACSTGAIWHYPGSAIRARFAKPAA